ncbi:MAG: peptide-methionine (S)-S-oxide reductase [Desulfosarcina sp.]
MESRFGIIEGVIRTRVGYAGGMKADPDYHHIGDHTETVQVDYDPQRITYDQLLEIFWNSHEPMARSWSRQYLHAVFYHDERQRQLAMDAKAAVEKKLGHTVNTEVAPLRSFTLAEDYHQKYLLKQHHRLKAEMSHIYPNHADFVNATSVARLNGYAGGNGGKDQLSREIDRLGLSVTGKQGLTEMVDRKSTFDRP